MLNAVLSHDRKAIEQGTMPPRLKAAARTLRESIQPEPRKPRGVVVWAIVDARGRLMISFNRRADAREWMVKSAGEQLVRCEAVKE